MEYRGAPLNIHPWVVTTSLQYIGCLLNSQSTYYIYPCRILGIYFLYVILTCHLYVHVLHFAYAFIYFAVLNSRVWVQTFIWALFLYR